MKIVAKYLNQRQFGEFGYVVGQTGNRNVEIANQGTAKRENFVANIANHRTLDILLESSNSRHQKYTNSYSAANCGHPSLESNIDQLVTPEAVANLCLFHTTPATRPHRNEVEIKLLERHKYSTQTFIPMTPYGRGKSATDRAYLVVVAKNNPQTDEPDMATLSAFVATSMQGYSMHPGIWHHPLIALDFATTFVCLVYERREEQLLEEEDTQIKRLDSPVAVKLSTESKL